MSEIAIIDDEKAVLRSLEIGLAQSGHKVSTFERISTFKAYMKENEPDIVFLDLLLPDGHGLDLLPEIKKAGEDISVIIITAHGDIPSAVKAMKLGAFDYISKPFDLDVIEMLVEKSAKERRLIREVEHHRNRSHQKTTLKDIIGKSAPMQDMFAKVRRLSRVSATTVLILGESGTGKDQLAKAIHNMSRRRKKQFIEINCAALPEQLIESELFGHERGAFTDARHMKVGLAELADGGTLFLDEVGELPLSLQAKLLKFLETRTFRRIGGIEEIRVDLFIIASTNRDLEEAVAERAFRQDLYYRMAVVTLTLPPLRDRKGDVDLLVSHYWKVFTHKFKKRNLTLDRHIRKLLESYDWPGNIRELRNLLEQLVILAGDAGVTTDDLPKRFLAPRTLPEPERISPGSTESTAAADRSLGEVIGDFEITSILEALETTGGNKTKAAEMLGISRYALLRKLKRHTSG
ncbi:MAG: sigma-54 dependent transcriptional regulator [Desulfobacter sp.]